MNRSNKELLKLITDLFKTSVQDRKSKGFLVSSIGSFTGLCSLIAIMLDKGLITASEFKVFREWFIEKRPLNRFRNTFWFTLPQEDFNVAYQKRLDFLNNLIDAEEA